MTLRVRTFYDALGVRRRMENSNDMSLLINTFNFLTLPEIWHIVLGAYQKSADTETFRLVLLDIFCIQLRLDGDSVSLCDCTDECGITSWNLISQIYYL